LTPKRPTSQPTRAPAQAPKNHHHSGHKRSRANSLTLTLYLHIYLNTLKDRLILGFHSVDCEINIALVLTGLQIVEAVQGV
jgi:hypothetical protein